MVRGVENGLRGFVPMSQLSYELSRVVLDHMRSCRRDWQRENPGACWRAGLPPIVLDLHTSRA